MGFWFAIDKARQENGCMYFLPGAHKGPLRQRNYRSVGGKLATMGYLWPALRRILRPRLAAKGAAQKARLRRERGG